MDLLRTETRGTDREIHSDSMEKCTLSLRYVSHSPIMNESSSGSGVIRKRGDEGPLV